MRVIRLVPNYRFHSPLDTPLPARAAKEPNLSNRERVQGGFSRKFSVESAQTMDPDQLSDLKKASFYRIGPFLPLFPCSGM